MTPYQGNPRWTAYPDPVPDGPVNARHRFRTARWLGVSAAAAAATLGLSAGAAYAYFTSHGSGTGSGGTTGTILTVNLATVSGTPTAPLFPGTTGDLFITVHNPNSQSVSITAVAFNSGGSITFDASHSGCATTPTGNPVVSLSVPAGDLPLTVSAGATTSFDLSGAVTMNSTVNNSCQGATIFVPVTITAHLG